MSRKVAMKENFGSYFFKGNNFYCDIDNLNLVYTIEANVDDVISFSTMVMNFMNDNDSVTNDTMFNMMISEDLDEIGQRN